MKTKVKLTDQQEEAVRAILLKQMEQTVEASQKLLAGKMTKEDMASVNKGGGNQEEEIKALLTPEQLDLYKQYKTDESTSNAQLVANAELLMMQQNSMGLTQQQEDQVYKALYEQNFSQLSGKSADNMPKNGDPVAAMQWQIDQKVKALETILSPDQLQKYRAQQENQAKLITSMMPGNDKKGP